MKLVLTLVCRDEEDIVDAMLAFHLNVGVDFVIATNHASSDGTRGILDRYAREGFARVVDVTGDEFRQSEWVTRMARLAATDFGADWVINADADEFWWPRARDLKDVFDHLPQRYGILRAPSRFFVPQLDSDAFFAERMTYRFAPDAPINSPSSPFRPTAKVAHRADAGISVGIGNHEISGTRLVPLRGWYPIEVLHFPLRERDQIVRKYEAVRNALPGERVAGGHITRTVDAATEGWVEDVLRSYGADAGVVADGVESGAIVLDTRLRDALRGLAGVERLPSPGEEQPSFGPSDRGGALALPRPSVVEDVRYAAETAALAEADQIRALRRFDELEGRVTDLERRPGARLVRALKRVARRQGEVS